MPASASPGFASTASRIDAIEEAYEFCLAYAAQGRRGNEPGAASEIRRFLERALVALEELADAAAADAPDDATHAFVEVLREDAARPVLQSGSSWRGRRSARSWSTTSTPRSTCGRCSPICS